MTRANVNITTLYSSAQCVLSVVGSVGVILLFAGIPQLIYSPVVSVANLMTFLLGAVLITTMVAGNSFLNYKYRKFTRTAQHSQRDNSSAAASNAASSSNTEVEDKPPSYEAILSLDGLPPDYFSVLSEKPPRYEDVATINYTSSSFTPAVPLNTNPPTVVTAITITENSSVNSCRRESSDRTEATCQTKEARTEVDLTVATSPKTKSEVLTTPFATQVTIGYDNDAYSEHGEVTVGSPAATDLRESES